MTHGSLFSGIGGFDLAAEWMGWENVFHCEWMPFPRKILSYYWPEAISYHDITTTDFRQHTGQIDILTGGFPCQPYSAAGKRKGKDDDRHLWPHMLRCIREVKPRWVVGENVFGIATWNGGLVFEEVCAELEAEGYAVQPFVLPAAAVNAPHRRDRVWFVAYAEGARTWQNKRRIWHLSDRFGEWSQGFTSDPNLYGFQQRNGDNEEHPSQGGEYAQRNSQQSYGDGDAADAASNGRQRARPATTIETRQQPELANNRLVSCGFERLRINGDAADSSIGGIQGHRRRCENWEFQTNEFNTNNSKRQPRMDWEKFPTQSPICGGDDGLPAQLDGITFPKWRAESIKGYGNAIVPQVALQIFKAIQQYEELQHES